MNKTVYDLVCELETRSPIITEFNLTAKLNDNPITGPLINIANTPAELDRVAAAVQVLVDQASLTKRDAEGAIRGLLSDKTCYGHYCELGAYEWLHSHNVRFQAQIRMAQSDVLNPNGCTIDGKFSIANTCFDVKGMGFQVYVAEQFRQKLEAMLAGPSVTIDGPMDVSVTDIQNHAFGQLNILAGALGGGGTQHIPNLGWTIRADPGKRVTIPVNKENPYKLAEENRYFPFKTAGQFTRQLPFLLVFAYAAQFNHRLFLNFAESTDTVLRALARRVFIQLTSDPTPVQKFDTKVAPSTPVAEAAKLLSGLLFINLDNRNAWLFLNPRATNCLTRDGVEQIFDFDLPHCLVIDDFAHDNY